MTERVGPFEVGTYRGRPSIAKAPIEQPMEGGGRSISIGFPIAVMESEIVANSAAVAAWMVEALNAYDERQPPFQERVQPWLLACFGAEIAADRVERNHRFLEEALELVQANGCTASEAHQLVDYVFGRPVGEPEQEVGGVMVTLAALCLASGLDMQRAGETELARIWTKVEQIRAKQAAKPKHSPLPAAPARASDEDLESHLPEYLRGEKRCGIQRSAWLTDWFVPWSPRNDNEKAEGPWSHWVALAENILRIDREAHAKLAAAKPADKG